ncbi:penicillin-binding protein 2 [Iodobacter fluviatilis]|uniref:Peptidoglycan D,D-transpeptidase MrdA n=1 Tax=Iodobacter fluviatilis TaxID=537 RepID=A0A377SZX6_9NEIS|nr:penicillin-binding protein 2 [Iodobacter fluviatilis]TCU83387.1 penicillin-binding protein 2 [Iodobacter fluviatilis]STR45896.1 Peptidoglycan synthase FtsI precursor [Iodobacter fluviatilis]
MSRGELKNQHRERYAFQLRIIAAALFVLSLFSLLFGRFFWLQAVQHDKYMTLAEQNRISLVPIPPSRGIIRDRNGVILAHNFSAYTLEITPSKQANLDETIEQLSSIIEITAKDKRRFKKLRDETRDFETLPIRTRLSDEEVARFAANSYRFPGVEIKARLFRHYPLGEIASHLIGYIGRINTKDLEQLDEDGVAANYRGTDHLGKIGIEQSYEQQLHGKTGFEEVEIDSGGRAVRTLRRTPPVPGSDLTLSVDIKLQKVVEDLFDKRRGSLVAIDPKTGGLLAMVSKPGFDPNLFVDGIDPLNWNELNTSIDKPLLNRAIRGEYPPGSTFKPFMALAALEGDFPLTRQTISDPGYFMYGNNKFRDSHAGGYGSMSFDRSIVVSSDTYFYQLAVQMGIDNIARFMSTLDFGSPTGVDLNGERPGVLPSPEWKKKRFKTPATQKWYSGETVSIGIGQGYNSYTPMQMAHATATLANRGVMFRPHAVGKIIDPITGIVKVVEPQPVKTMSWKSENVERVIRGMEGVIREGTGARTFAGANYIAAGKTGTAQVYSLKGSKYNKNISERLRDHSWFIVFAPADKPTIALAVIVENGGFGAQAAAPIARQALDFYLNGKMPAIPKAAASSAAPQAASSTEEIIGD